MPLAKKYNTKVKNKNLKPLKQALVKPIHSELLSLLNEEDVWLEEGLLTTSSFLLNDSWKNKKRNWGHSLHSMASRSGSFPPALADFFISKFSGAGDKVLDPFSGKGTTPLQACLTEREGIGVDVAPEAYALTAAKVYNIDHKQAVKYLVKKKLDLSLVDMGNVPEDVKVFYHDETLKQLLALRIELLTDVINDFEKNKKAYEVDYLNDDFSYLEFKPKNKKALYAQYWIGVMIGILHGSADTSLSVSCSHSFSMSPGYVKNYSQKHGLEKPIRDVKECLIRKSKKLQADFSSDVFKNGRAILGSAMKLPNNLTNKVDLVVTSPPYFTAQTYAWDNWLREWFLGFNFKHVRTKTLHTNVEEKYSEGMFKHLEAAYKALKKDSWAFIVVGDVIKKSKKGDKHIVTAQIIAEEAKKVGFSVELIINDAIPPTSRYNSAFLKRDQGLKLDRIVCLYKQ